MIRLWIFHPFADAGNVGLAAGKVKPRGTAGPLKGSIRAEVRREDLYDVKAKERVRGSFIKRDVTDGNAIACRRCRCGLQNARQGYNNATHRKSTGRKAPRRGPTIEQ